MAKKLLIPILLIALVLTPAYAFVGESDGFQTTLQNAVRISDPQISQIYYETLRYDQRHFYTFDAAQGETIKLKVLIPLLDGLENYMPTIAFYESGSLEKQFLRFSPPMFFGEIEGTRSVVNEPYGMKSYENQNQSILIGETGTYVFEIFDEGSCLVIIDSTTEKKCDVLSENPTEFFEVIQGKYALQIGTDNQDTIHDDIHGWIQTRIFYEDPIGDLIRSVSVVETGDSPENIQADDYRWLIFVALIIIAIVIVAKRKSLSRRL